MPVNGSGCPVPASNGKLASRPRTAPRGRSAHDHRPVRRFAEADPHLWGEVGWEELTEGALVASQPNGAASWFPCDDHPSSKASYRIAITTDTPYYTVANGTLVSRQTRASQTTWVYEQTEPMASYLATIQIGVYQRHRIAARTARIFAVLPPRCVRRSTSTSAASLR